MKDRIIQLGNFVKSLPDTMGEFFLDTINQLKIAREKLKNFAETNYKLGIYHIDKGNMTDAKFRFFMVSRLEPNNELAHYHLARCHLYNLNFDKAKEELKQALEIDKNFKAAKFRLKFAEQSIKDENIPIEVIEEDYNNLADSYETIFTNQFTKDIQEILAKLLAEHVEGIEDPFMIDLGCGTGMVGYNVRNIVAIKSLLGIDISGKMLDYAKELTINETPVYNHVRKMDFHNLSHITDNYDIITACLSFEYCHDLLKLFKQLDKIKARRAVLGLAVLKSTTGDVVFDYKNSCYSFSLEYLNNVFKTFRWKILEQKDIKIMSDGTHGLIFILKSKG